MIGKTMGRFVFGIKMYKLPNGVIHWKSDYLNESMPLEIIFTHMRAFLENNEDKFYNELN